MSASWQIIEGDCIEAMREMSEQSVQCCITSPPYFGLRDYGVDGQIGLEDTPDEYVARLVDVFREVRRVLRDDGTLWLNLGDSYAGSWGAQSRDVVGAAGSASLAEGTPWAHSDASASGSESISATQIKAHPKGQTQTGTIRQFGVKPKDLYGIPWLTAFALRADGWYLRAEIVWAKPNPMPESVQDRPTRSHEQVFLLSKAARYFYDADAIREEGVWEGQNRTDRGPRESAMPGAPAHVGLRKDKQRGHGRRHAGFNGRWDAMTRDEQMALGRNKRSVWTVATQPYPDAHFATFPPKLIEPMVLAGSRPDDTILDPFAGAGTTGLVALRHQRSFIGIDLNPDYCELARNRIRSDQPLFNVPAEMPDVGTPPPNVPAGRYAVLFPSGQWRLFRIWRGSRNPNIVHAYEVRGTEKGERADRLTEKIALMLIRKDVPAAAIEFGHRTGSCSRCGKGLDVNLSRKLGIGPDCLKHWFERDSRLEKLREARADLRRQGLDPGAKFDSLVAA